MHVNVNVKAKLSLRNAVQIMNLDGIHETKKCSVDDVKQSETRKAVLSPGSWFHNLA